MRNYSAMSAAILASAVASGQVVLTDIDDLTFSPGDADGGQYNMDLNDDGTIDFTITIAEAAGGLSFVTRPSDADLNLNGGAFVGMPAGNYQYPQQLAEGDVIDTSSPRTDAGVRGDLNFYGCAYDNSEFCDTGNDAYLGLVFDFNGNSHFGWALMDYATDAATGTFTIKAFAFDATPEAPITASLTLGVENEVFNSFEHFMSNEVLTLKAASAMENVVIYNINGQVVLNKSLSSTTETVDLSAQATGVYIAKVTIDGAEKSFKITK